MRTTVLIGTLIAVLILLAPGLRSPSAPGESAPVKRIDAGTGTEKAEDEIAADTRSERGPSWTPTGGGDHGGQDWTPEDEEQIAGVHYNINKFLIQDWVDARVQGALEIRAERSILYGDLYCDERGYNGGRSGGYNPDMEPTRGDGPGGGMPPTVSTAGTGAVMAATGDIPSACPGT